MTANIVLPVWDFGARLIETQDLDPVYVGLAGLVSKGMSTEQLARWLLAYWCFYHVGAASWLSEQEGENFWAQMTAAAANEQAAPVGGRWPRSAERRHFRGSKCVAAVAWFAKKSPVDHVLPLTRLKTANQVMERVREWPLFGPWIAFKAADMLERCAGASITFPDDLGLVYQEPRSALDILAGEARAAGNAGHADPRWWWVQLQERFRYTVAPPHARGRNCGVQEVETVLCKWKSHYRGHYWVGKDIAEVRHALDTWGETAAAMQAASPKEVAR